MRRLAALELAAIPFCVCLLASSSSILAGQGNSSNGTAALSGVVIDGADGRPLAGVTVELKQVQSGAVFPPFSTDSRGRFVFAGLPASGDYILRARRFGFLPTHNGQSEPNVDIADESVERIRLAEGQWISDVALRLWRLGSVRGRVSDEAGEPVVGVAVQAFSTALVAGRLLPVAGPIALSDDRGEYRLTGFAAGDYSIGVLSVQSTVLRSTTRAVDGHSALGRLTTEVSRQPDLGLVRGPGVTMGPGDWRLVITDFPIPPTSDAQSAYPAIFYPGVRTIRQAKAIPVRFSQDVAGVDFQLFPVAGHRVCGRSSPEQSEMMLRMLPVDSETLGFGSEAGTTVVGPTGDFCFLNVPDGNYVILGMGVVGQLSVGAGPDRLPPPPGFGADSVATGGVSTAPGIEFVVRSSHSASGSARKAVVVNGDDVVGLELAFEPPASISGRIVLEPGSTLPSSQTRFSVTAEPANGDPSVGRFFGTTDSKDSTNSFTIAGLPAGRYLLRASSLPAVSVMLRDGNVADRGIQVAAGENADGVIITLTSRIAEVSGAIWDRGALAAPGTLVVAFPADERLWVDYGWNPRRLRLVRSIQDGKFVIKNLPEGDYFLAALSPQDLDQWPAPSALERWAKRASRVRASLGEVAKKDLTVLR